MQKCPDLHKKFSSITLPLALNECRFCCYDIYSSCVSRIYHGKAYHSQLNIYKMLMIKIIATGTSLFNKSCPYEFIVRNDFWLKTSSQINVSAVYRFGIHTEHYQVPTCAILRYCILLPGGRFKNAYELLNLRALKISMLYKNHIFQCMSMIFCVEFQRVPLKFHTKYHTHTLKDVDFIRRWQFKSS